MANGLTHHLHLVSDATGETISSEHPREPRLVCSWDSRYGEMALSAWLVGPPSTAMAQALNV